MKRIHNIIIRNFVLFYKKNIFLFLVCYRGKSCALNNIKHADSEPSTSELKVMKRIKFIISQNLISFYINIFFFILVRYWGNFGVLD